MSDVRFRQFAKISSLESARALFLIIVGLAVREALLFLVGHDFHLWTRRVVTFAFLFTAFRFSHGVAVVYELEKKATETTTTPSAKKVELIFGLFTLEAIFLFLMATRLASPLRFAEFTLCLLAIDLAYITVSKTLRDLTLVRLLWPFYWRRRWKSTETGTAPRAHVQWAISDFLLALFLSVTMLSRAPSTYRITLSDPKTDWAVVISLLLVLAGAVDYWMNREFYFGAVRYTGRECVFVSSPLTPTAAIEGCGELAQNIRRAQWYCRKVLMSGKVPFASHAFYPYFLNVESDRKLGRKSAHQLLAHCSTIHLYTPNGGNDEKYLSEGMREELRLAKVNGLEIKYVSAETPSTDFAPRWTQLTYPKAKTGLQVDLEREWKKIFVCSPVSPTPSEISADALEVIRRHIRVAHWLCRDLVETANGGSMLAVFAPQAFYPYFADYQAGKEPAWTEFALEVLRLCDAIYIYTEDGLESQRFMTAGMSRCLEQARSLGLEIQFHKITKPPEDWDLSCWTPPILEVAVPSKENSSG